MKSCLRLALVVSALLLQASASQAAILYAAQNNARPLSGATDSVLITLDPTTGAVLSTIGQTGFVISDLAVDPTTGVLYASTARAALANPNALIRIDTATGAGTLIGPFAVGDQTLASLAFDSAGTLYGWESRRTGETSLFDANLHTVDLATGAATLAGDWDPADQETRGNGLAFDSSGTLFWSGRAWATNELNTVNPATGLVTGSLPLTGFAFLSRPLASLSFDDDGTLFGVADFGNAFAPSLLGIDTLTGAVTVIGLLPLGVNGFAFSACDTAVCLDPRIALNPPDTSHTVTVTVVDTDRVPVAGEFVDFAVTSGPNAGEGGTRTTDANGTAEFTYLGDGGKGVDRILASTPDNDSPEAFKFWDANCNANNVPDTCDLSCDGFSGLCSLFFCGTSTDGSGDGIPDECLGTVGVDVKPGPPSVINVSTADKLEVAILGSETFSVLDIDQSTLAFGPSGAAPFLWAGVTVEDIDVDDFDDLIVFFRLEQSGIEAGDTEVCVTGELTEGTPFSGCDAGITAVACGLGFELVLILPPLAWLRARHRRS